MCSLDFLGIKPDDEGLHFRNETKPDQTNKKPVLLKGDPIDIYYLLCVY